MLIGPQSMDAHILKDPVQQREVKEITNFAKHDAKAKQERYHRRVLKKDHGRVCPGVSEYASYTEETAIDAEEKEDFARRSFELDSTFTL
jgi:hypothetical protein